VTLQWKRPVDGVEKIRDKDGIELFAPRSDRIEDYALHITDLEDPVVMRFINGLHLDQTHTGFLSRFGMLKRVDQPTPVKDAGSLWFELTTRLFQSTDRSKDPKRRTIYINALLEDAPAKLSFDRDPDTDSDRLTLHPENLFGLMALEVALAHEAGATTVPCEHCHKFFLIGPLTGRRTHAKYCSDRCRVAAMRKRKKEGSNDVD
jgi:hypothetical protein